MNERAVGTERLVGDVYVDRRTAFLLRTLVVGTVAGIVAGAATFVAGNIDVSPIPGYSWLPLLAVVLAGVYVHLLVDTLRESFAAAGVAFLVGGVVCIAAWIYPVFALGYTGMLAELMIAPRLRDAVVDVITLQLMLFAAGYLGAVTVFGLLE